MSSSSVTVSKKVMVGAYTPGLSGVRGLLVEVILDGRYLDAGSVVRCCLSSDTPWIGEADIWISLISAHGYRVNITGGGILLLGS